MARMRDILVLEAVLGEGCSGRPDKRFKIEDQLKESGRPLFPINHRNHCWAGRPSWFAGSRKRSRVAKTLLTLSSGFGNNTTPCVTPPG